jgi:Holliday junction resolvase-like predicted endonuclease
MINHFPNEAAAEAHLTEKGFAKHGNRWVSRCGLIDAWITTDIHRGVYVTFLA